MSDPIIQIISLQPDGSHLDLDDEYIFGYIESQAEEIRQQIGRELLSKADLYGDKEGVYTAVKALDIREVCQMEES